MNLKDKLKELRNKLTSHKLQNNISQTLNHNNEEKQSFNITISKNNGIFKVEISDYITVIDYSEKMKQIDAFGVDSKLTNGVLWNGNRQRINKGVYFAFSHNGKLYNILNNEEFIKIEERTKIEDETEEKIITFKMKDADYSYFKCMHDKNGSSYLTRYYGKNETICTNLELSNEEFSNDLNLILSNLETLEEIGTIVDIWMIRQQIFEDLNKKQIKRKINK